MTTTPFAAVTVLDTAVSIGPADATIVGLDYRFAGDLSTVASFIGTLASVGTGDSIGVQVSPDWRHDAPGTTNAGAMWATVNTYTSTAINGSVIGLWSAIRFIKPGTQTAKVVGLFSGKSRAPYNIQG